MFTTNLIGCYNTPSVCLIFILTGSCWFRLLVILFAKILVLHSQFDLKLALIAVSFILSLWQPGIFA